MRALSSLQSPVLRHLGVPAVVALLLVAAPRVVAAQQAPPHLAVVDGAVSIDRESDSIDAVSGEPLVPGDRLRTGAGRAEVWFPDGSTLDLDGYTTAEFESDGLIRLMSGRAIVVVARGGAEVRTPTYQIDTPGGSAVLQASGEYRVSLVDGDEVELTVLRGAADLLTDAGSMSVRSGERTSARENGPPSAPQMFNSARLDAFDEWARMQHDQRRGRALSTQYLPSNLQMYGGTFDRYGRWEYEPAYGYVWYPTVAPGWRPYYNGYWRPLPSYGWTWVDVDLWGWPTHHYGRWGYNRSRWYWIPERRWAPAWVYWASAPDYVSWCPLGFDNRPVFSFSLSVGNTWAGWVVLPRTYFGARNVFVNRYAFDGRRLARNLPFAVHANAPIAPSFRGRVEARNSGIRPTSPSGGVAVPRSPRDGYVRPRDGSRSPGGPAAGSIDGPGPRAYRRAPSGAGPSAAPSDRGNSRTEFPRAMPRYRNPGQFPAPVPRDAPSPNRQVMPRAIDPRDQAPPRQDWPSQQRPTYVPRRPMSVPVPQATPVAPSAPDGPREAGRAMRRPPNSTPGAPFPSPRSSGRFENRPEPRASAPPRETPPPSRSAERTAPRGESRGDGGTRSGGQNAGVGGAGGHGRRRP